jgi:hypothetical protein
MIFRSAANKRPLWPLIMILACFLLFLAMAAMGIMKFSASSSGLDPAFVEKRFKEHLDFLRELAVDYEEEVLELEEAGVNDPIRIPAKGWLKRLEEVEDRFSDPVVVGARVYTAYSATSQSKIVIKECDASSFSSLFDRPGVERPVLLEKIVGTRHMVSYENLVLDSEGTARGYQLIIDLNRLPEPQGY